MSTEIDELAKGITSVIIGNLEENVKKMASATTAQRLAEIDVAAHVKQHIADVLKNKTSDPLFFAHASKVINEEIASIVKSHSIRWATEIDTQVKKLITDSVAQKMNGVDVFTFVKNHISKELEGKITNFSFPDQSIPATAIKQSDLAITGDQVFGGIIKKFESTGIQDKASQCTMTLLDDATVIENRLVVSAVEVAGSVVINGDLVIKGSVPTDIPFFKNLVYYASLSVEQLVKEGLLKDYSQTVFDKILESGLDLKKITIGGKEIIDGNKLGYSIVDSNLQRVGLLNDLQVKGEVECHNGSFYVGNKRVGVNTSEPESALAVWDEEVSITAGKRSKDTAVIQTPRQQVLILGSNNKDNLKLHPDGTVQVTAIQVGKVVQTSGATKPNTNAPRGVIVWNDNPDVGLPIGWVSLGGGRWAGFGKIDS